jgi:hypothetical protein
MTGLCVFVCTFYLTHLLYPAHDPYQVIYLFIYLFIIFGLTSTIKLIFFRSWDSSVCSAGLWAG